MSEFLFFILCYIGFLVLWMISCILDKKKKKEWEQFLENSLILHLGILIFIITGVLYLVGNLTGLTGIKKYGFLILYSSIFFYCSYTVVEGISFLITWVKEKRKKFFKGFVLMLVVVNVFYGGKSFSSVYNDISEVEKKSEKYKDVVKNLLNNESFKKKKEDFRSLVEEMDRYYRSEEFQRKVKGYEEVIKRSLGERFGVEFLEKKKEEGYYVDFWRGKRKGLVLGGDEKIYVLVSSGIPKEVIKSYLRDSSFILGEVKFILRGGVEGLQRLSPTARWVLDMLKKDDFCDIWADECILYDIEFQINPLIFRKYKIERVPVFIYVKGNGDKEEKVVISPGSVSVKRHLERIGEVLRDKRFFEFLE